MAPETHVPPRARAHLLRRAVALAVGICLLTCTGIFLRPQVFLSAGARLAGLPPEAIRAETIDVSIAGRVTLTGLSVAPLGPGRVRLSAEELSCDLPSPFALLNNHIDLGVVDARGFALEAAGRRRPRAAPSGLPTDYVLTADQLNLTDSTIDLAEDPPLRSMRFEGISGSVRSVAVRLSGWHLEAAGSAAIEALTVGATQLTELRLEDLWIQGSEARFSGHLRFGEVSAAVAGSVGDLLGRGDLELTMTVERGSIEALFEGATGAASPIRGAVLGQAVLHAGGDLGRGESWWEASFTLSDATIALGNLSTARRALLRLAPWFPMEGEVLILPDLHGALRFGAGWVTVDSLHYRAGERALQIWGSADGTDSTFVVRTVPDEDDRAGVGVIFEGGAGGRLARREELQGAPPLRCEHADSD